ncbi:MAG TPA: polyamine ABC transporter substrate-binding protein [Anaerolineae bacterium]
MTRFVRSILVLTLVFVFGGIAASCAPASAPVPTQSPPTAAPAATTAPTAASPSFAGKTLNVSFFAFNQDLIDKNIVKPFEQKYGAKVVFESGNNADRLAKLVARKDNPNIDVVAFTTEFARNAMSQGVIKPYDPAKLSNLNQLYSWAKDPLGNQTGVGYTVSSYSLFYRTDKVNPPITSWKDLWRKDLKGYESLPDITTTNGPATIYLIAKAWGGDMDNDQVAWDKLAELKDSLVTAYKASPELITLVKQGDVWAAGYSKFAWGQLLDTKVPLKSVTPTEGVVGFVNTLSIIKGTPNEDLAYAFVDFMISQQVQQAEALDLVDSPVNQTVKVPDDIAPKLTYGDDVIKSLVFLDDAKIAAKRAGWIDRWNKLMAK